MDKITIVIPQGANVEDTISVNLRNLTKILQEKLGGTYGYGLGGEFGYGVNFENDIFMIHPYCWCEKEDCPWCCGCTCPDSAFHYFIDNKEVSEKEWNKYYDDRVPPLSNPNWKKLADEVNRHRTTEKDAVCKFCKKGLYPNKGTEPGLFAPNFWHKPSGLKIWWYKWIGRGMEVSNLNGVDIKKIFKECILSLH